MSVYSKELEDEVVRLYENQVKPTDIAKQLSFRHWQPVYDILKRRGVYEYRKYHKHKPKYSLDKSFFRSIDTEEKAYVSGFIVADGHVDTTWYRVVISLHQRDVDILEKIKSAMSSTHPIKYVSSKNQYCLSVNSKEMVSDLVALGLTSNKSLTMDGTVYSFVPEALKKHFLRGYFDGDGCMTMGKKYSSGTKWSIQIIGTREFLLSTYQSWYPSNCKLHAYKSCNMHCWKLASKKATLEFLALLYENSSIHLDRKYKQWLNAPI